MANLRAKVEELEAVAEGLQATIDTMEVEVTYMKFDIEATVRERNYFRKLYEDEK